MKVIEVFMNYLTDISMAIKITGLYFIVWFVVVIGGKITNFSTTFFKVDVPKTGYQKLRRWFFTVGTRIIAFILNIGMLLFIGSLIVAIAFWYVQEYAGITL